MRVPYYTATVMNRVYVYAPEHPHATDHGYVLRYRLLMENALGRQLSSSELVHHRDGNTLNDQLENLEILSRSDHERLHSSTNYHPRYLDYELIQGLMDQGLDYKRIARLTGYSQSGAWYAVRKLRVESEASH